MFVSHYQSPLGPMTLSADSEGLTGVWFDDQKYFGSTLSAGAVADVHNLFLHDAAKWLDDYFAGRQPQFCPQLHLVGSDFRQKVWSLLLKIPYGQVATYKSIGDEVATRMGVPHMSAQAVGGAVGHNPISIIVPCHRVLATSGSLTGYAGGLERKRYLLRLEGINL